MDLMEDEKDEDLTFLTFLHLKIDENVQILSCYYNFRVYFLR